MKACDAALASGDTETVTSIVEGLLRDGAEPVSVLTDAVAAAQREVGRRWQLGEFTVAQEHVATAVAISATKVVAARVRQVPVTRGMVLVACAERDWHALPAMMIECALRAHGWDTTLLGASTNPGRLNQYLHDLGPDAAAHGAIVAMDGLPAVVAPAEPPAVERTSEQSALESDHRRLVARMREQWSLVAAATTPDADYLNSVIDVADDVLHQILHAVEVALLTGDHRVLAETAWWTDDLLRTRGAGPRTMGELVAIVTVAMRDYPLSATLLTTHFALPADWRHDRAAGE